MKLFDRLRNFDSTPAAIEIPAILRFLPQKTVAVPSENRPIATIANRLASDSDLHKMLSLFCLDDCAIDPEPGLIDRLNRMAFEFMQHDGISFEAAIKTAADIVVKCGAAVCEASYLDVQALWKRISAAGTPQAPWTRDVYLSNPPPCSHTEAVDERIISVSTA